MLESRRLQGALTASLLFCCVALLCHEWEIRTFELESVRSLEADLASLEGNAKGLDLHVRGVRRSLNDPRREEDGRKFVRDHNRGRGEYREQRESDERSESGHESQMRSLKDRLRESRLKLQHDSNALKMQDSLAKLREAALVRLLSRERRVLRDIKSTSVMHSTRERRDGEDDEYRRHDEHSRHRERREDERRSHDADRGRHVDMIREAKREWEGAERGQSGDEGTRIPQKVRENGQERIEREGRTGSGGGVPKRSEQVALNGESIAQLQERVKAVAGRMSKERSRWDSDAEELRRTKTMIDRALEEVGRQGSVAGGGKAASAGEGRRKAADGEEQRGKEREGRMEAREARRWRAPRSYGTDTGPDGSTQEGYQRKFRLNPGSLPVQKQDYVSSVFPKAPTLTVTYS